LRGHRRRVWAASGIALALLAGCAPVEEERVAVFESALAGGERTDADEAVVGIVAQDQLYCTGTLVAGHVVLTAAHCLPPDTPVEPSEMKIFAGASWAEGGWIIDATDVWVHPEHLTGAVWKDVGLLALQHAPAAPIPVATAEPLEGTPMRILGFGKVDPDSESDDIKRTGSARVESVLPDGMLLVAEPAAACGGDSGGPALVLDGEVERLAGVHSRGTCEFQTTEMRVDLFTSDINAFIDAHPPPACEADDRCALDCPEIDPDCPVEATEEPPEEESGGCSIGGAQGDSPWEVLFACALCAFVGRRREALRAAPRGDPRRPRGRARAWDA
jgi:hypothetical protein